MVPKTDQKSMQMRFRKLSVKKLVYDVENPHLFLYDNDKTDMNFDIELENGTLIG